MDKLTSNNVEEKEQEELEEQLPESGNLTFWEHLEVLRWMIFRIVVALFVFMIGAFIAMPYLFDGFVLAPTTGNFFVYRWLTSVSHGLINFNPDFSAQIININVASQFMTHITTSLYLAAILAFPYMVYEIWRFISPALFENEKKPVRKAMLGGTLMFFIGCAVGYLLVFPFTFRFLVEYQLSGAIQNQINLSSYIGIFSMMIFVMGIVFEMPLVAWLLSMFGILHKDFLRQYKRHAIVVLLILAAIITPSGDPVTLMVVFLPLFLLYEFSIFVVKD